MLNKVGKIISYNEKNGYGYIINKESKSLFFDKDILDESKLEVGNIVTYREEKVHSINRAYFVKKLDRREK